MSYLTTGQRARALAAGAALALSAGGIWAPPSALAAGPRVEATRGPTSRLVELAPAMLVYPHFRGLKSASFLPTDLGANLRLWTRKGGVRYQDSARTTLVTAATNPIGSWTDQSGLSNHGTSSSTGRPLEPTGRDGANFDGADDTITTPSLAAYAGDFFVGLVLTPDTLVAGYVRFLERVGSGGGVYLGTAGAGSEVVAFVSGAASPATALSAGAKHVIAVERRGTTGRVWVDGVNTQTWTVPATAIPDASTIIGGPDGSGPYYDGVIHEVVIAKDVSAGDVTNLLAYLATV